RCSVPLPPTPPHATATLALHAALPISAASQLAGIRDSVVAGVKALPGVGNVTAKVYTKILSHAVQRGLKVMPNVKNIIAVASGKDRKSTRLNSSHVKISYAVFCLKKKK